MNLKNLKYVGGFTYEVMMEILEIMGVKHNTFTKPRKDVGYFRIFCIEVECNRENELINILGRGKLNRSHRHFYGKYQLEPGFDIESLDGDIKFEKGFLIERVSLLFRKFYSIS